MAPRPLAAFALVLVLAGCTDRDEDLKPVIPPLPAETVQRAEAGDAAAQFALADHYRALEQPEPMLRWLRESAQRGYPLAQTSLGAVVLGGGGRGRLSLACRRGGLRWRLVGLVRFPGRGSALRGRGVRRLGSGRGAAVAAAGAAAGAARSGRVGAGGVGGRGFPLGAAALPPPLADAVRWLQRQFSHWQFKPLPYCRFRRYEIHHQRIIVRRGGFGFRPVVPAPAVIEARQGGLPLRLSGL